MDTTEIRFRLADAQAARSLGLRMLIDYDVMWLRAHRAIPPLYQSPVRYLTSPCGGDLCEDDPWVDVITALSQGFADCKSLVAWRIAELLVRNGEVAVPVWSSVPVDTAKGRAVLFHVRLRRSNGAIECPSTVLGMTSLTGT